MSLPSAQIANLTDAQAGGYLLVLDTGKTLDPVLATTWQSIWRQALQTMPWLPAGLPRAADTLMASGYITYPMTAPEALDSRDDNDKKQWSVFVEGARAATQAAIKGQLAVLKTEALAVDRNKALWDAIAKWSGQAALAKVWDDLWAAVAAFRASREASAKTLATSGLILAGMGAKAPAALRKEQEDLDAKVSTLTARARTVLAPLGDAGVKSAGLGVAPLIIAGIVASGVVAIAGSVWAIAHEMASVQKQANDHAQQVLVAREAMDRADFEAGKITAAELTARRKDNTAAAVSVSNAQGAGAIGSALGKAGAGVALGIAAVVALGIATVFLLRKSKSAP